MHEVALARSVARIAQRAAAGRRVLTVSLDVGVLRQVVPEALQFAWRATSRSVPALQGARLEVRTIPARITCRECGSTTPIGEDLVFACATCGSTGCDVAAGNEFTLTSIDVI